MAEPNDDHVVVAQCVDRVRLAVDELAHAMRVLNSSRHVQRPDATDDLLDERQGPQSRMLANNDRGVLQDVERLGSMSIVVLGLNGIGCMIAETFCRSGIGSITVCDNTTVFPADLGRSFYRPDDVGSTRVDRVQAILAAINHSVVVQKLHVDLVDRSREFEAALFAQPQTPPPNVIFVTVDDLHVVQYLNTLSLSHEIALVHVCMAPNGLSGTVLTSVPRRTPCLLVMLSIVSVAVRATVDDIFAANSPAIRVDNAFEWPQRDAASRSAREFSMLANV
ncbi:hypothetical protein AeMF1_009954 [Aphanomyces euteiches]|nr:hypothetical protein AeMF1_009954 [Aphanomyces euteiches]